MTTVKDLILALQKFPMDTPVFIYSEDGECDGMVDKITFDTPPLKNGMETAKQSASSLPTTVRLIAKQNGSGVKEAQINLLYFYIPLIQFMILL